MTKALTNYDKIKISTAHVFLQYNQATMIHKYSLDYNSDWLYITFINRTYRINRKTGSVQWSDNDFEIIHEKSETSKCYLVGDVATKEINLEEDVKGLNVKKLPLLTTKVGNPICLIATRSSIDFE